MTEKPIKLIALDLDGTLFNSQGKISEEDQAAIREAVKSGVEVVISTGRPYIGLPVEQAVSLGIHYAITTNGAGIYRLPDKECIYSDSLPHEVIFGLLQKLSDYDVHFDVFVDGNAYTMEKKIPLIDKLSMPEANKYYIRNTRTIVKDVAAHLEEEKLVAEKMTVNFYQEEDGTWKDFEKVRDLFANTPEITFVSGGCHNLEVTARGVKKGKGLQKLADYLRIPIEQTMSCGDTENDLDIMLTAGIGVSMANGEEIALKNADYITASNDESGVAQAIRKFVLK